jgi:hypothetical protein
MLFGFLLCCLFSVVYAHFLHTIVIFSSWFCISASHSFNLSLIHPYNAVSNGNYLTVACCLQQVCCVTGSISCGFVLVRMCWNMWINTIQYNTNLFHIYSSLLHVSAIPGHHQATVYPAKIIINDTYTELIQHHGNIQTNGTYNNIAKTSVRTTQNNMQNTDAAGGKLHE